jgi:hypothetical protein
MKLPPRAQGRVQHQLFYQQKTGLSLGALLRYLATLLQCRQGITQFALLP